MTETAAIRRIAEALDAFEALAGVPVIWKTPTMWHARISLLAERRYHHCAPFCAAVKECAASRSLCNQTEYPSLLQEKARCSPSGWFAKICHAGCIELVVSTISHGAENIDDRMDGVLIAGPFRRRDQSCATARFAKAFRTLPLLASVAEEAAIAALLGVCAVGVAALVSRGTDVASDDPRIREAVAHIRRHLGGKLRVGEVARRCGMSESRFIHLFSKEMGVPFSSYVLNLRVEEAKRLLVHPGARISEVAATLGFHDQSHLCAAFKRIVGMSPRCFIHTLREQA